MSSIKVIATFFDKVFKIIDIKNHHSLYNIKCKAIVLLFIKV